MYTFYRNFLYLCDYVQTMSNYETVHLTYYYINQTTSSVYVQKV